MGSWVREVDRGRFFEGAPHSVGRWSRGRRFRWCPFGRVVGPGPRPGARFGEPRGGGGLRWCRRLGHRGCGRPSGGRRGCSTRGGGRGRTGSGVVGRRTGRRSRARQYRNAPLSGLVGTRRRCASPGWSAPLRGRAVRGGVGGVRVFAGARPGTAPSADPCGVKPAHPLVRSPLRVAGVVRPAARSGRAGWRRWGAGLRWRSTRHRTLRRPLRRETRASPPLVPCKVDLELLAGGS